MTVWILFQEWESGGDGGHACISSVHASETTALLAQAAEVARLQADGFQVWNHPTPEQAEDPDFDDSLWDVDVHLEPHEVTP